MQELKIDLPTQVFDAVDGGLIVLDTERRVVTWNAWMTAAAGISAEAARGQTLRELFPSASLRQLEITAAEALGLGLSSLLTRTLHPTLLPLRTRAGRELIYDISVRPIGERPYSACLVQITDVTLSAHRERVLRERQNARYAAVVDNAPDPILTVDTEGLVQFANPTAALALGYPTAQLTGKPVAELFEEKDIWASAWRAVLAGEVLQHAVELVVRRQDGSPSYVEVSASRWFSDSRTFVTLILRDANARHAAEAALRRLNETLEERVATALAERKLMADIVETTDAFIQVVDLDYRILAVNKASVAEFERNLGVSPRVGDNILDLLADHPTGLANTAPLWKRALAGEEFSVVQAFETADRGRRYYELKFDTLHDASGQRIAAYQFVYDVTERIERQEQLARTEEALRQSQKMEAIGQLTGGIAHDFNNLLMGITGAMDILRRRIAAGRFEDVGRFMDAATASANRAAALTHRLLAFARRQPLAPKPLDANQLILGIEDMLRRTLSEQVTLTIDLSPEPWPVLTDPNQLENAVLNLAINARDAMPGGGRLTIDTANISLGSVQRHTQGDIDPGDYLVVRVSDTGVGMEPEMISKVVEPFFTTKPIGQGTGLGLSMIYGFIKQTNGHVIIESTVGSGTQVSLYIPRFEGELEQHGASREGDAPEGLGETVLLVEDDASVRLLIAELLRDLGYACLEATDANEAIPILTSSQRLDLIITDVGLPGLNGRQLAELARQSRPDLKVLFVTGYARDAAKAGGFLDPGMEMVTKPFTLDALATRIRDILAPQH
jgi:PAS domain S-box-containing protein